MDSTQAIQIGVSLLGGGAVGAIIAALVASYKARLLPIGRRLDISPLFESNFGGSSFKTSVTVTDGATDYKFPNLHLAELQIVNRANKDLASFHFGVTLDAQDKVVYVEPRAQDRHHVAVLKGACNPAAPSSALDFELRPLNRGDTYTFRLYIVATSARPGPITVGSSEAIRFSDMPSIAEVVASAAKVAAVSVGPFEVRIGR